jgi:hypothetical protein
MWLGANNYASMNVYSCCSPLLSEQSIITGPTYLKEVVEHHQKLSSCAYVSWYRKQMSKEADLTH